MPSIPDYVTFGANSKDERVDYGYVRRITDEKELIDLLRRRLSIFFVHQVQSLQHANAPFPRTTMTCIGIETLGEIFIAKDSDDKSHRFVTISKQMSQEFGRKLSKKYDKRLKELWSTKDLTKIDCYGKLLYRFFRNTMIHGYQGKGVYLSYEDTNKIEFNEDDAFIKMNPNWFWNSFKHFFNKKIC